MKKSQIALNTLWEAINVAKRDNCRANRKSVQRAKAAYTAARKEEQDEAAHLAAAKVEQEIGPTVKKANRRIRQNSHKLLNKQHKAVKVKAKKVAHTPPTAKPTTETLADAPERYAARCEWEALKADRKDRRNAAPAVEPVAQGKTEKLAKDDIAKMAETIVEPETGRGVDAAKRHLDDARKAVKEHPYRVERHEMALISLELKMEAADKMIKLSAMTLGRVRKAYKLGKADYAKLCAAIAHYQRVARQSTVRHQEYAKQWQKLEELKAELPALEKNVEFAKENLRKAKHDAEQEKLEECFRQRYDRAEYVPEKEDKLRYKVYAVAPHRLLDENVVSLIKELNDLSASEEPDADILLKQKFAELEGLVKKLEHKPFVVDAAQCAVNNVAQSQLSDILSIRYGEKTACTQMILVNHEINNFVKIPWRAAGVDYNAATDRIRVLKVALLERLLWHGVEFRIEDKAYTYGMLASSPTQQKKGQLYMGEVGVLKATQEAREFGMLLNDAIPTRPDNAAEYLKREATLLTPSVIYKTRGGEKLHLQDILMMGDTDVERTFDNVLHIDGTVKLPEPMRKALKLTKFDGQAQWLINEASNQMRGYAIKAFCAGAFGGVILEALRKIGVILPREPESIKDLVQMLGEMELPESFGKTLEFFKSIQDKKILMTKSCWKASKMGLTWDEFVEKAEELSDKFPDLDCLRVVRFSDREIGDEENPRNLARQATQQWIEMTDEEVDKLTRGTRRWLKRNKELTSILARVGEWDKAPDERSDLAKVFNRFPELLMHPYIKQYLKMVWDKQRDWAAAGRLRTKGCYPFIVQDPVAFVEIHLLGKSPEDTTLGVLGIREVDVPKATEGREMYAARYPMNYIVGMVVRQRNCECFRDIGNVAVLSYHDDVIIRADGDFDGDEMLFIFDEHVIAMIKKTVAKLNPSLIDFPHSKCEVKPFGTKANFCHELADALFRAMEFNLVGTYSNLAVILLHLASETDDPAERKELLTKAAIAHVGAIVCLDMVKGANVPQALKDQLRKLNKETRKAYGMPWNQQFAHPNCGKTMPRSDKATQDRIAGSIVDDVGEFELVTDLKWSNLALLALVPEDIKIVRVRNNPVPERFRKQIRAFRFEEENDAEIFNKIMTGKDTSWMEWMEFCWHNESALAWKMTGEDLHEKKVEFEQFVREVCIAFAKDYEWVPEKGGQAAPLASKYASVVKNAVCDALGFWVTDKGEMKAVENRIKPEKRGIYAMFVLRVFAKDILRILDLNGMIATAVESLTQERTRRDEYNWLECPPDMDYDASVLDDSEFMSDGEYLGGWDEYMFDVA